MEVEHWKKYRGEIQVFLPNSECQFFNLGSQNLGAKVQAQKGKSPDLYLRSLNLPALILRSNGGQHPLLRKGLFGPGCCQSKILLEVIFGNIFIGWQN